MKRALVTLAVAGLVLAGCGSSKSTSPGGSSSSSSSSSTTATGDTVAIKNYSFSPATLTVKVGTTVTWTQDDSGTKHSATDAGVFDSTLLPQGKSFSYKFTKAGTYNYICTAHQFMKGTIIVQ